jgi:hypothetical protein
MSGPVRRRCDDHDMSRDTSQISGDRRLWLSEPCPSCGAHSGLRCQTSRHSGKPTRWLHAARGWRQRSCPTCKTQPGELCRTPTGRRAAQPHTARLSPARRELLGDLLKALPAGRIPRPAASAVRPRRSDRAQAVRTLPGPNAQRRASGGALLLKALPAGRIPRPARARTQTRPSKRAPGGTSHQLHLQQPPGMSEVSRDMSLPAAMPAILRAIGFELVLHVEGYEFPQFDTGWDGNALRCLIDLRLERYARFHASHQPIIYTIELERFAQQLQTLDRDRTGRATFEHGAEAIGLTLCLDSGTGTGTLEGFLADTAGGRLSFDNIEIDHAFAHHARTEVDDLVGTYPVRGSLQID